MNLKKRVLGTLISVAIGLGIGCRVDTPKDNNKESSSFYENAIVNVQERYTGENILDDKSEIYIYDDNINSAVFEYVDPINNSINGSIPLTGIGDNKYEGNLILNDGISLSYKVTVNYGDNKEKPTHNSSTSITLSEEDALIEIKEYLDNQNCVYSADSSIDLGQLVEYDFYITEKDGAPISGFINYFSPNEDETNLKSDKQFIYSLGPNYDYFLVIEKLGSTLNKRGLMESFEDFYNSL